MGSERTAEEVQRSHVEAMGVELGSVYHALWNELAWLHQKWDEYVEIFGTKPSRVDLVNKVAPSFFRVVQDSLWEDSLLHVARLTDSPSTSGKNNLSIRRLPQLIDDKNLEDKVATLVEAAVKKADFCRDWRNRHIAHKDLALVLNRGAEPLQPASRASVKDVLTSMAGVLNAVSAHYLDSTTVFEGISTPGGAIALLYALDDSVRLQAERRERMNKGDFREEDYRKRDL